MMRPPAGPRPSPESRDAALASLRRQSPTTRLARLRLVALGGGMGFFSGPGLLGGGGLRLGGDHARHLGWIADVSAYHGSAAVSLGQVSFDVLSLSAALVAHLHWSRIGLRLGGGVRGGAARLAGRPNDPRSAQGGTLWAPWVGPIAHAGLSVAATRRLVFDFSVEGGYVIAPIGGLVGTAREAALDGTWIGFQLGAGLFL